MHVAGTLRWHLLQTKYVYLPVHVLNFKLCSENSDSIRALVANAFLSDFSRFLGGIFVQLRSALRNFVSFIQLGAQCASRSDMQTLIALRCGVDPENTKFKHIVAGELSTRYDAADPALLVCSPKLPIDIWFVFSTNNFCTNS